MNKRILSGALAAAVTLGVCAPAQALSAAPQAALRMGVRTAISASRLKQDSTPGIAGSTLNFDQVERVVRARNVSIQAYNQTLAGERETDVGDGYITQRANLEAQIAQYQKQIRDLDKSIQSLEDSDENAALIRSLRTQKKSLEQSLSSVQQSYSGLNDQEEDDEDEQGYKVTRTERQLNNSADQIVLSAENAYISIYTLENSIAAVQQNLAALDRSIALVQTQIRLGAATSLDLLNLQTQRESLSANLQTLQNQRAVTRSSLAVLCGYGAGESVKAGALPEVSASAVAALDYDKDLAAALKNSYTLWSKQDAVDQASRDYKNNVTTTLHTYEAAKIERDAAQEDVINSFRQQYNSVKDKYTLLESAQSAYAQQKRSFAVSEIQYQRGAISKNDYQSAQDALTTAEQAVSSAQIDLFTAYNTYQWAKRGVI